MQSVVFTHRIVSVAYTSLVILTTACCNCKNDMLIESTTCNNDKDIMNYVHSLCCVGNMWSKSYIQIAVTNTIMSTKRFWILQLWKQYMRWAVGMFDYKTEQVVVNTYCVEQWNREQWSTSYHKYIFYLSKHWKIIFLEVTKDNLRVMIHVTMNSNPVRPVQ